MTYNAFGGTLAVSIYHIFIPSYYYVSSQSDVNLFTLTQSLNSV